MCESEKNEAEIMHYFMHVSLSGLHAVLVKFE